jgi:hypothetical protein
LKGSFQHFHVMPIGTINNQSEWNSVCICKQAALGACL